MRYGLLGERLSHSFSPQIHSLLGAYEYQLYEKAPEDLEDFFLKNFRLNGINVTIPYKQTVIKFCNQLSESARAIGSVNTIIRRPDGTLYGDNTDFYGITFLLEMAGVKPSEGKTVILGSGGSSLTTQAALRAMGGEVIVVSRSGEDNYSNLDKHRDAKYLINTTPVGMYPNNGESPITKTDFENFKNMQVVVDLIYNPALTELMLQAEERNIPVYGGLAMLVAQAKRASELFTGKAILDKIINQIINTIERQTKNIVLIGMPGCGKTSIGTKLAEITKRQFVDSDEAIIKAAGKPIPEIFRDDGEEVFRTIERSVLKELCKKSSLIIATGGGVVTGSENYNTIRQNSTIVFLDRDITQLSTEGRPLSVQSGVEVLAKERLPIYQKWADCTVPVQGIDKTAALIIEKVDI